MWNIYKCDCLQIVRNGQISHTAHMETAVQVAADRGQLGLPVRLLGLSLGLPLQEPLLQRIRLKVLLLAGPAERLVEPRHALRLPPPVRLYSSSVNTIDIINFCYSTS